MFNTYRKLILFFIIFATCIKGHAEECSILADSLKNSIGRAKSIEALDRIAKAKLTVLAEVHYEHYFWKLPSIYKFLKYKNPRVNCLFSEISQDASAKQVNEVIAGYKNEIFYSTFRLGFGPLYESIRRIGDRVVLVDAPIREIRMKPDESEATWLMRRDSWMLQRIKKAFLNNECAGGIYNIGSQHIWDQIEGDTPYLSFGSRVKKDLENVVIVEQVYDDRLDKCSNEIPSFVASSSDPVLRSLLYLDGKKSSADYVLYLRKAEIMPALVSSP